METIKHALGLGGASSHEPPKKVRYGIVAMGNIAQCMFMPGLKHSGNSEIAALVTGDWDKAVEVATKYNVIDVYKYDRYEELLRSGKIDAVYISTPNWRHLEFALPALEAGIHVLLEKPMEISTDKCIALIEASKASGAKLMIGYRLHFEIGTNTILDRVRAGEIGEAHMFTSIFTQFCDKENHRAKAGVEGGPIYDMGTYPTNAARAIFDSEPIEVMAMGTRHPEAGFSGDFDDTVSVTLRFPGNKIANFVVSYYGNFTNDYTVVGTKGSLHASPAYLENAAMELHPYIVDDQKKDEEFPETDHFGGEAQYFSDCILNNTEVEPDGEEGLADVRVLEAVVRALNTKQPQTLEHFKRTKRIDTSQTRQLPPISQPDTVNVKPPTKTFT